MSHYKEVFLWLRRRLPGEIVWMVRDLLPYDPFYVEDARLYYEYDRQYGRLGFSVPVKSTRRILKDALIGWFKPELWVDTLPDSYIVHMYRFALNAPATSYGLVEMYDYDAEGYLRFMEWLIRGRKWVEPVDGRLSRRDLIFDLFLLWVRKYRMLVPSRQGLNLNMPGGDFLSNELETIRRTLQLSEHVWIKNPTDKREVAALENGLMMFFSQWSDENPFKEKLEFMQLGA